MRLQAALFGISVAVGLTPEMLPMGALLVGLLAPACRHCARAGGANGSAFDWSCPVPPCMRPAPDAVQW